MAVSTKRCRPTSLSAPAASRGRKPPRAARSAPHGDRPGITLVEIVMVIFILAILSAAVTPRFFASVAFHRVESAAHRIQFDCEWARRRAKTQSSDQIVRFSVAADSYTLVGIANDEHEAADYMVELSAHPYGASIVAADFGGETDLVFNGFGLPKQAGRVVVQSGASRREIRFDPQTGTATVSDEF